MKLISKSIIEGKLHITESRDCETDTKRTALLTHGEGEDHYHTELDMSKCIELRDFLNKLIKLGDK